MSVGLKYTLVVSVLCVRSGWDSSVTVVSKKLTCVLPSVYLTLIVSW